MKNIPPPHSRLLKGRSQRTIARSLAVLTLGALIAAPLTSTAVAAPTDQSEAQGQILRSSLLSASLADLGTATTGFPSSPGPSTGALNVSALSALNVNVGSVALPLLSNGTNNGLLNLGGLGALNSYASSPNGTTSTAASGAVSNTGVIQVNPGSGVGTNPAYVDPTALLGQLGVPTAGIVDQARVELGALASSITQSGSAGATQYAIAGLNLKLHSPLVGNLAPQLAAAINTATTPVGNLVATGGALDTLLNSIRSAATVNILGAGVTVTSATATINGLNTVGTTVTNTLLTTPLQNTTGSVKVNLADGSIQVDLAKILLESGTGDINSLPPNTQVLSAPVITAILNGVTDSINGLSTTVVNLTKTALNNLDVTLNLGLQAQALATATGSLVVSGKLADFAGTSGNAPTVATTLAVNVLGLGIVDLGPTLNGIIQPVVTTAITNTVGPAINAALNLVGTNLTTAVNGLTGPLLTSLSPVLNGILNDLVQLTINEQDNPTGDLAPSSFTVRALSVGLLPKGAAAKVGLASSTIRIGAAAPTITAAPNSQQDGKTVSVTGTNFTPNQPVSLQLVDGSNNPVGSPVTANAAGDGTLPATSLTIPAGTPAGTTYKIIATQGTLTANTPLTVTNNPQLASTNTAPAAGTSTDVSGTGWVPNEAVTVTLVHADGTPVAGASPVVVPAASVLGDGSFAPEAFPIPGTATAGNYKFVGTQASGRTAELALTVGANPNGNVNASASAAASANATAATNA
ncbi:choice-of-anchor G family protein, partial [Psychromicrobium xiongbiense]|uniref:choice-of-anchor G family protein n=1 Tax=Psychromicrobium xiongbiense TaxID=3051184 RepID=UPI0025562CDF